MGKGFRSMLEKLIIFALLVIPLLEAKKTCREKIMSKYPKAKCVEVDDLKDCKGECEHFGEQECQGKRGQIEKLNCKHDKTKGGKVTCCCNIDCESSNVTLARLDDALREAGILDESYMCVTAEKNEIKEKLKEACRQEEQVQIARKYCLEEKKGKYYCLKDGKCFGNMCKGCIKHECEINDKKEIMNPPKSYIDKVKKSGNIYDNPNPINVDDRRNLTHMRKWCTKVPNKGAYTFKEECLKICKVFGKMMCRSEPEKIEPTNDCHGSQDDCQCCCKPSCDESKITDECRSYQPSTTEISTLCTEEDKGGLAVGYDYEDEQTEPTTYKKKYKKPETRNSETKENDKKKKPGWRQGVVSENESDSETETVAPIYEEDYEIQAESSDIEEIKAQTRLRGDKRDKKKPNK